MRKALGEYGIRTISGYTNVEALQKSSKIMDLLSWIRLAIDSSDNEAFVKALVIPVRTGLSPKKNKALAPGSGRRRTTAG